MSRTEGIAARLLNQRLVDSTLTRPEAVVSWLGAVQAQEYGPARWGLAQRMVSSTDAAIAQAFDEGRILRTHVLRPTWHFVVPSDIRWILALSAPRVHAANGYSYRTSGLDPKARLRGSGVIARALEGARHLTRTELAEALRRARLPVTGQALACMVMHAELEGIICSGPRRGRQFTYALIDERVAPSPGYTREEALAELTRRYFTSRGPATIRDFVWWSGLTVAQARAGIDSLGRRLASRRIDDKVYWQASDAPQPVDRATRPVVRLLPIYDEFLIAFRDRDWVASSAARTITVAPNVFEHQLVVDGRVEGGWKVVHGAAATSVTVTPWGPLARPVHKAIRSEVERYAAFLQRPVTASIGR